MIGSRTTRSNHLHFAPKKKHRFPIKSVVAALVVIALLVVAGGIKAAVAATPGLDIQRVLPASEVLPGPPPQPAWPAHGEAAVEIEGLPPLGSSGSQKAVPIASLAKIMTAYVILHDFPLRAGQPGFSVTISAADVTDYNQRQAQAQSVVPVAAGETLSELQLLQGLLVPSGNNVAIILADHDAGSVSAFVAKMNSTAQSLGMTHSHYTDPSGLESSTVSNASDQLILASRAMSDPVFAGVVAQTSVTLPVAGTLANFNSLAGRGGYVGIKTGSDSASGGCLVFANHQTVDGHAYTILGAVLAQDPGVQSTPVLINAAVAASDALVNSVKPAVAVRTAVPAGTVVAHVTNREGKSTPVTTSDDLRQLGYGGMGVPVSVTYRALGTSLGAGRTVADVTLTGSAARTQAVSSHAVPAVSFGWKLAHDY